MGSEASDAQATLDAVARHLMLVDVSGPEWTDDDKIRYVRVFLEEGVAELADADDAQLRFMAECVLLAGENMQDARLHIVEQRLDDLDNPDENGFAAFLVNLGLMLALELLVVAAAQYAIPTLILFAVARSQARGARKLVSAMVEQRTAVEAAEASRQQAADVLAGLASSVGDALRRRDELRGVERQHWTGYTALRRAERAVRQAQAEYSLGRAALERSEAAARRVQERAVGAAPGLNPTLVSGWLQRFLSSTLTHSGVSRVAENSAGAVTNAIIAAAGDSPVSATKAAFHTSDLTGRFLSSISRERQTARAEWAALRRHLRILSDGDLETSEVAHDLFLRLHDQADPTDSLEWVLADREFLTRGFEGALWLAWLTHQNALAQKQVRGLRVVPTVLDPPIEGRMYGDLLVTDLHAELSEEPGSYEAETGDIKADLFADGVRYPGVHRLSDEHALYLYGQFARSFYVRDPGSAPSPLKFDVTRYDAVPGLNPTSPLGGTNRDRTARIAEMKVLVIVFFQLLRADPATVGGADPLGSTARTLLRRLLGLHAGTDIVGDFLSSLPPVSEPDDPEEVAEPESEPAATSSAEQAARDALFRLGLQLNELDLLITHHDVLYPPGTSPDGPALTADAEALKSEITAHQQAVLDAHAELLELAASHSSIASEAEAYRARIETLLAWPEPSWQFYGPPAPPQP